MRQLLTTLWTLRKDSHQVAAELHWVELVQGYELVFTWNRNVHETHMRRGDEAAAELRGIAEEKQAELEGVGGRRDLRCHRRGLT